MILAVDLRPAFLLMNGVVESTGEKVSRSFRGLIGVLVDLLTRRCRRYNNHIGTDENFCETIAIGCVAIDYLFVRSFSNGGSEKKSHCSHLLV